MGKRIQDAPKTADHTSKRGRQGQLCELRQHYLEGTERIKQNCGEFGEFLVIIDPDNSGPPFPFKPELKSTKLRTLNTDCAKKQNHTLTDQQKH